VSWRRKTIALVAVAAAGAALATPAAVAAPLPGLCGIAEPIDRLLACPGEEDGSASKPAASTPRYVSNRLLVKFKRGAGAQQIRAALAAAKVKLKRTIPRLRLSVVSVAPADRDRALAYLRAVNVVARAEKDVIYERLETVPDDEYWSQQWGLRRIRLPAAWDRSRGSGNVSVAVLDTGVDGAHPDLAGVVLPAGYDFVNLDANPTDDEGHGTAVAGVIGARTNNHEGQAGVCWTCTILPEKVLGANGEGDTAKIALALVRAADAGARVINMSFGGPGVSQALAEAVAYAAGKGAILIAAAGNSGRLEPFYPAAYPQVISVAATDPADHLYEWSNYGSWVAVAAPGCNVAPGLSGGYVNFCGTSSAAPVVSGLAALVLAANPGATRNDVVQALERGVVGIGSSVEYGRVDAPQTLSATNVAPPSSSAPPAASRPSGVTRGAAILRATLTRAVPARSLRRSVGPGRIRAALSFHRTRRLSLSILDARGRRVARVVGRTPLRLALAVSGGTYRFVVRGRGRRIPFKLVVSYPLPASAQKR
jgi:subtilisin family serine protease